jgi:hypothetical protein
MKRSLAFVVLLLAGINTASAAIVTSISNLLIGTQYYDVTIHTAGSFNEIWDLDGDGIFGEGDGSIIDSAPTFWGDPTGAMNAAQAVINALGSVDSWGGAVSPSDSTMTPYAFSTSGRDSTVVVYYDAFTDLSTDTLNSAEMLLTTDYTSEYAFVSYKLVPLPAAIWLFGSALVGLGFVTRKRKSIDTA